MDFWLHEFLGTAILNKLDFWVGFSIYPNCLRQMEDTKRQMRIFTNIRFLIMTGLMNGFFTDSRFNILHLPDKLFLDFLCLTIHPTVRDKEDQVVTLLEIYNNNLSKHQIEIVKVSEIAERPVFEAKAIQTIKAKKEKILKLTKLALVVGCADYIVGGTLPNPTNDADSMDKKLISLGFEVIKVLNPSQKELKMSIDDFGEKLKNYEVGLFYFAGHGVQVKGLNYLIPVDANIKSEKMVEYDCVEAFSCIRIYGGK